MRILDTLIFGLRTLIDSADAELPLQPSIKFTTGTLTDDAPNTRTLVEIPAGTGTSLGLAHEVQTRDGATVDFLAASEVTAQAGFLAVGTTPAVHGQFRVKYAPGIGLICKKDSGGTDHYVITHDGIGGLPTHFGSASLGSVVRGSEIVIGLNDYQPALRIVEDGMRGVLPYLGDQSGIISGMHGHREIDMTNSDTFTVPADWPTSRYMRCTSTPAMLGLRHLWMPNATVDADAYPFFVQNDNGSGFAIRVQDAALGTSVDVADGKGAWLWCGPLGVRRMTADV